MPEQPQVGLVNLVGQAVPPPPPITGNVDPTKIEEIRRTIYVGNLNTNVSFYIYVFCYIFSHCCFQMHTTVCVSGCACSKTTATVNFLHYSSFHYHVLIDCVGVGIH